MSDHEQGTRAIGDGGPFDLNSPIVTTDPAPIITVDPRFKTIRGDQAIADDLKTRAVKALEDLNAVCSEAEREGFRVVYQNGQDAFGRFFIQIFQLLKKMG